MDNEGGLWRTRSIPEKVLFAAIYILILKIGQTRKQFREMENTTCSVLLLMNWDTLFACIILMNPIRWWLHFTKMDFQLKTNTK